jgi:hypothetical protein
MIMDHYTFSENTEHPGSGNNRSRDAREAKAFSPRNFVRYPPSDVWLAGYPAGFLSSRFLL